MKTLAEEFLAQFDPNRFPPEIEARYELLQCLAQKEAGAIFTFLARDKITQQTCVVKCYDGVGVELHEGEILQELHYPGIPSLLGQYKIDDSLYLIREYVEGQTLQVLTAQGSLSQTEALQIMEKLCDIVAYLHKQQPPVIHRDIKPSNVVMNAEGTLGLIDFEIARWWRKDSTPSDTLLMCTQDFSAPEQFGYAQSDQRTDVYSLGVLLYYLLTGRTRPHECRKWVSDKRLAAIIEKSTNFSPEQRYQSADQLKKALQKVSHGKSIRKKAIPWIALGAGLIAMLVAGCIALDRPDADAPLASSILAMEVSAETSVQASAALSQDQQPAFASPLIQRAAAKMLGKEPSEEMTLAELAKVREIFIIGDEVYTDSDTFWSELGDFEQSLPEPEWVTLETLSDFAFFPDLKELNLAYLILPDLSPVNDLSSLSIWVMRKCQDVDLTPVEALPRLKILSLMDSGPIQSLSALGKQSNIQELSLSGSLQEPMDFLQAMPKLSSLVLKDMDSTFLRYLSGKDIDYMLLDLISDITFSDFPSTLSLRSLSIYPGPASLDGIENIKGLEELSLWSNDYVDFSPLLACKKLKIFRTSPVSRSRLLALEQALPFKVE